MMNSIPPEGLQARAAVQCKPGPSGQILRKRHPRVYGGINNGVLDDQQENTGEKSLNLPIRMHRSPRVADCRGQRR